MTPSLGSMVTLLSYLVDPIRKTNRWFVDLLFIYVVDVEVVGSDDAPSFF